MRMDIQYLWGVLAETPSQAETGVETGLSHSSAFSAQGASRVVPAVAVACHSPTRSV